MNERNKGQQIGLWGSLLVHALLLGLLLWLGVRVPKTPEDAGGVPVMFGNTDLAAGQDDPALLDVDLMTQEATTQPTEVPVAQPEEQTLLTQTEEKTVAIQPHKEVKKPVDKPRPTAKPQEKAVERKEKTQAEKEAEARREAEVKTERERKAAEEAARRRVANAFGRGAQMGGNRGEATQGTGTEGSATGNASTGAKSGTGGYGTFALGGRSLGAEGLPRPTYGVQEEGRVVVNITVSPEGKVIATGINPQTNTVSTTLRKAAEEAARKARFNAVDSPNNQTGTITYYFKLR